MSAWRDYVDRLVLAIFAAMSIFAAGAVEAWPDTSASAVTVVFPPWVQARDAVARATQAGADLLRLDGAGFIVTVHPLRSNYAGQVLRAGAILVAASSRTGCSSEKRL